MSQSAKSVTNDYEIIFVNDGSPDDSLSIAQNIQTLDDRVVIVDLSRNFGHHKAIMAGLAYAQGDLIFLIDCDLEEDPENLPLFYKTLTSEPTCDVIYGCQHKRKGGSLSAIRGYMFYKMMNMFSDVALDANMVFSRLMTKRYVESLLQFKESEFFIVGIWKLTGYTQKGITIPTRHRGVSSYTFAKLLSMVLEAVTSFCFKPLEYMFWAGVIVFIAALLYIVKVICQHLFWGATLSGWTSIFSSILFFGGLNLMFIGMVGLYVSKSLSESKRRPFYIVRQCMRRSRHTTTNEEP